MHLNTPITFPSQSSSSHRHYGTCGSEHIPRCDVITANTGRKRKMKRGEREAETSEVRGKESSANENISKRETGE